MKKALFLLLAIMAIATGVTALGYLPPVLQQHLAKYTVTTNLKAVFLVISLLCVVGIGLSGNNFSDLKKQNKAKNNRPNRSKTNELGSGDLASVEQIAPWLKKTDPLDTCLYVKSLKGSNGIAAKEGRLIIPHKERNRHILIIAKTGSGKTTKAILPILYHDCLCPLRSTIVLDSKPEMWDKLAAMTRKYNPKKNIILFNPLDRARSLSWNILAKVENDTDCKLIANTIVMATDNPSAKADTPFFRNNALQLLNAMMVGLLNDPNERLSMPRVHELLHTGMSSLCDWLEAHPQAIRNARTFVDLARSGSQNSDTILSELGMRLSAWDLKDIRATTFLEELDLESLIAQPTLFIIELRESELEMLRPLANVLVIEILRFLAKRAEGCPGQALPRPVGFVIDEFASALGRLPDIHVKLNTLRSRNVSIVAAIQSIAQIKANYEKDADSVIAGFTSKILMPTLDFQDSEWASKETGTMTVRFNTLQHGKNKRLIDYFASRNDSISEQVQQRPVLTPDEIGRPIDDASTFFLPSTPVFQGHLIPYYESAEMAPRIGMKADKGLDLKLRDAPIEFEEKLPEKKQDPAASGAPSAEQLLVQLSEAKEKLGWTGINSVAKKWWEDFEAANSKNLQAVLLLAQELLKRGAVIADFYSALKKSGLNEVEHVLAFLDQETLQRTKEKLGWGQTRSPAREWWIAFEDTNKNNVLMLISLSLELASRRATIEEFFLAYSRSNSEDVETVLAFLDSNRLEINALLAPSATPVHASTQPAETAPEPTAYQQISETMHAAAAVESLEDDRTIDQVILPVNNIEQHEISQSFSQQGSPQQSPLQRQVNVSASAKQAAKNLHVNSYYEMCEQFLQAGNIKDFHTLIRLAADDTLMTKEDMSGLWALAEKHGVLY